jgi:hypothetical protein
MNRMREENPDRSEPTAQAVRALLILSPFLFAFCYFLALVQGASEQAAVVIGLGAFGMYLGAAGLNQLRGPKAAGDLWLLVMIMKLIR